MALYYQTEYRLGRRGGRICRSYTGFQAFVAIVFDLIFGLVFELIFGLVALAARLVVLALQLGVQVLTLTWRTLLAVATAILYAVTLPFALLHDAIERLRSPGRVGAPASSARSTMKPEWALSREV
jgi:hypothetical protein